MHTPHYALVDPACSRGAPRGARTGCRVGPLLLFAAIALGPSAARASGETPALAPGWNRVMAGHGTQCVDGSEYSFLVRPGDPHRLAIIFSGGGACWSGGTCDTCTGTGYRMHPFPLEELNHAQGLCDFHNPQNPIRDYTAVFIPSCTGDVHLGSVVVDYPTDTTACHHAPQLRVRHVGSKNAGAALDWVFAHYPQPRVVFVTGQSAGAIPSPFYAVRVARAYPRARIVQLGDAAGGYDSRTAARVLPVWGGVDVLRHGWGAEAPDTVWDWQRIYVVAARLAPKVMFAQVNAAADEEQAHYLAMVGITDPVAKLLASNLDLIHGGAPRFRAYTAAGTEHAITVHRAFYTVVTNGVRLRDWVAALLENRAVTDVGSDLLAGP